MFSSVICEFFKNTVVQRCSVKKVFLEISQNSQENTFARAFFLIKISSVILGHNKFRTYSGQLLSTFNKVNIDLIKGTLPRGGWTFLIKSSIYTRFPMIKPIDVFSKKNVFMNGFLKFILLYVHLTK